MRRDLEQKLIDRWPTWFDVKGDLRRTLMSFGFQHGDGWFDLLWRLCEDIEPFVAEYEKKSACRFEVLQVKEKFGGLRFYIQGADGAIRERIEHVELESFKICEVCGKPGQRRSAGWIKTLCEGHAVGRAKSNVG